MTHDSPTNASAGALSSPAEKVQPPGAAGGPEIERRITAAQLSRIGRIIVVLVALAAIVYWLRLRPVEVHAHSVQKGAISAEVMGTGTLEARVQTAISPKISGRIARIFVDEGDRVSAAQVLVQLDDAELRQQVEIATATAAVARAALDRLKADTDRALAVHQLAQFDYERTRRLYEQDTAANVEIEKATEALGIAQAELARAEAAIVEAERRLIADEKTLAYHQARLGDTQISAPFEGLIVRRRHDPGDVVVPGSSILTLIATDEIWISAWVDETQMARLRPDQTARVVFRSEPDRLYPGCVARLGRETDRETREFVVDVRVLEFPLNWAVGQRGEVYIETDRKEDVVVLPATHVMHRDQTAGALRLEDGRAAWQPIDIGLRSAEYVEVTEGLQAGDVALMPFRSAGEAVDGRRVKVVP